MSVAKPVVCFDTQGNRIEEFLSAGDAFRATGTMRSDISAVCSGKKKTAGGYMWRLKEEVEEAQAIDAVAPFPHTGAIVECHFCNREYRAARAALGRTKFCSKKCQSNSRKGSVPWNKGLTKEQDIRLQESGIKGSAKRTGVSVPHHKARGRAVWNKGKKCIERSGANHHNWKGGKTSESRKERVRFGATMQKSILRRDQYKCQLCGTGGDLHVDHIKSWSNFPEFRFCEDNCRTLCEKCHYEVTFGRPMTEKSKGWGHHLVGSQKVKISK